jgi:hypothetical protein
MERSGYWITYEYQTFGITAEAWSGKVRDRKRENIIIICYNNNNNNNNP